jgi:hypothetical protein
MGGVNSGRPKKEVDLLSALDLLVRGESVPTVAECMGISAPTLRTKIDELKKKAELISEYREVQPDQFTELQAKMLENISDEKLEKASLKDLVTGIKTIKNLELVMLGKPTEINGLVSYLIHIEQKEKEGLNPLESETQDAEYEEPKRLSLSDVDDIQL